MAQTPPNYELSNESDCEDQEDTLWTPTEEDSFESCILTPAEYHEKHPSIVRNNMITTLIRNWKQINGRQHRTRHIEMRKVSTWKAVDPAIIWMHPLLKGYVSFVLYADSQYAVFTPEIDSVRPDLKPYEKALDSQRKKIRKFFSGSPFCTNVNQPCHISIHPLDLCKPVKVALEEKGWRIQADGEKIVISPTPQDQCFLTSEYSEATEYAQTSDEDSDAPLLKKKKKKSGRKVSRPLKVG